VSGIDSVSCGLSSNVSGWVGIGFSSRASG
jgi:hypothetical protein